MITMYNYMLLTGPHVGQWVHKIVHKKLDFIRAEKERQLEADETEEPDEKEVGRRLKADWGTEEAEKDEPEFMKHDEELDNEDDSRPRCRGRHADRKKPTAFRLDCAVHRA